jgi:hypothetical protein
MVSMAMPCGVPVAVPLVHDSDAAGAQVRPDLRRAARSLEQLDERAASG